MSEKLNIDRRRLLQKGTLAAGLVIVDSFLPGCEKDTVKSSDKNYEFDINSDPILAVEGGAVMKQLGELNGGRQVIIIRSGEKKFTVLSSVCTHQGCQVNLPDKPGGEMLCPCHVTKFSSVDGHVISGPATDPLTKFATSFDAEKGILSIRY